MLGVGKLLKAGRPPSQLQRKGATTQRRAIRPSIPAATRKSSFPPSHRPTSISAVMRRSSSSRARSSSSIVASRRARGPTCPTPSAPAPVPARRAGAPLGAPARPSASVVVARRPAWSGRHDEKQQLPRPRPLLLLHCRLSARADPLVLRSRNDNGVRLLPFNLDDKHN